ncbi:MAG: hypothetical protein Q9209_006338 [Squamulea sp. 1 TL-2023]
MSETPRSTALIRSQRKSRSHKVSPATRLLPPDNAHPKFKDLVDLALLRVSDAATILETRPPRLFPTTETVFASYYTHDDWLIHGDLETELGRMRHMLLNLPERGMPTTCITPVRSVLSSGSVLNAWERMLPRLKTKISGETQWVTTMMRNQQRSSNSYHQKSTFVTIPIDYRTDAAASGYGLQLWETSLSEFAAQVSNGYVHQAKAFLQIFAYLKDPLGGLQSVSDKAVSLFAFMMTFLASSACQIAGRSLIPTTWQAAVAQAAQEALFLACPLLETISYIHFTGHQQLPYVYVELDQLPRSEFSIPEHVLHIVEEILTMEFPGNEGSCPIAPISISTYPALPLEQGKQMTVIIDGNHRATATMVLRMIAEYPVALNTREWGEVLDAFCTDHGLGAKWKVDLAEVVGKLNESHFVQLLCSKMELVQRFRNVRTIPALVVREDHFHTACQQRPALEHRPRLLLPIHQALYNDEELSLAFPQAGQVHGCAVGFKAMPLIQPTT